jgi:hypothetical protein
VVSIPIYFREAVESPMQLYASSVCGPGEGLRCGMHTSAEACHERGESYVIRVEVRHA